MKGINKGANIWDLKLKRMQVKKEGEKLPVGLSSIF